MTLPTLIQKHQEKVTVNRVKSAYSILNQAYTLAKVENGDINGWFTENSTFQTDEDGSNIQDDSGRTNQDILWDKLIPHLKVATRCKASERNCKRPSELYTLTGNVRNIDTSSYSIINLVNGISLICGWIGNINCKNKEYCGDFAVDINGIENPPNATGKDIFYFFIQANAITAPTGSMCDINNTSEQKSNGYGCTERILTEGTMDYLRESK